MLICISIFQISAFRLNLMKRQQIYLGSELCNQLSIFCVLFLIHEHSLLWLEQFQFCWLEHVRKWFQFLEALMETNFDLVKKSHSQFHPYRSHNSIWREHITSNMKEKTCLKHYYSNNLKTVRFNSAENFLSNYLTFGLEKKNNIDSTVVHLKKITTWKIQLLYTNFRRKEFENKKVCMAEFSKPSCRRVILPVALDWGPN